MATIDHKRVDNCEAIVVTEAEALRVVAATGAQVPEYPAEGPIIVDGEKVGYASNFNGVTFTDKDFIKGNIDDILWYVN